MATGLGLAVATTGFLSPAFALPAAFDLSVVAALSLEIEAVFSLSTSGVPLSAMMSSMVSGGFSGNSSSCTIWRASAVCKPSWSL
ncbi:hypothetical protein [Mesorhizobium amorphae]|uniref:hypothetical protein n=1 Tax=Mesorhizobium amorphae TaxID=71433 RepID=UPI001182141F|nr:hypothetical protein [Mesorhizobium amorphae]